MGHEVAKAYASSIEADDANGAERATNLKKLASFFDSDLKIKQTLASIAPSDSASATYLPNSGEIVEYYDKFYNGFLDIQYELQKIMDAYYHSYIIANKLQEIGQEIIRSGGRYDSLKKIYIEKFCQLDEGFVRGVQEECKGYYIFKSIGRLEQKATSINEMLHLLHSYIVNDDSVLRGLPILKEKGEICLYGSNLEGNDVAGQIFDMISQSNICRICHIVTLPDRILMMVRDRGHALSIEITKDAEKSPYYVKYFIPKIISTNKVNKLPGVNKVGEGASAATGEFIIKDISDVAQNILEFVKEVPTDADATTEYWQHSQPMDTDEIDSLVKESETMLSSEGDDSIKCDEVTVSSKYKNDSQPKSEKSETSSYLSNLRRRIAEILHRSK